MLAGCVPWPEEVARRYRALGYWEGITLAGMLERAAREHPDKAALIAGERRQTYGELARRSRELAGGLQALGIERDQRVVFQLANSIELVEVFFALMHVGAIPIMALPAHRRAEIAHFAAAGGAVAHFIPDVVRRFDYRPMAREVRGLVPGLRWTVVAGDAGAGNDQISLTALVDRARPFAPPMSAQPQPGDVALMLLSGGTTGLPKLIPRTHDDYLYAARSSALAAGMGPDTVLLAVLPMAHNYTFAAPGVIGTLALGGTVVIADGVSDDLVFPAIERHGVTMLCAAVPLVAKWLGSPLLDRHRLGSLRVFMNGGAKLAPELRRRVEEKFGCTYVESFGTAEGLLNQTRLGDPLDVRMESSGRPVSPGDEIKVVDEEGREVPDGVAGELVCRGPYTIRGYYNAPEITRKAFTTDGFYRMGDVVRKRDGYLYLEGRKKDLINRGGEKISCEEVENYILGHQDVESACVVAMPDELFGEKACAFVILRPGRSLTLDQLVAYLQTREFARFKLPERLEVVESFPISPAGKVLRRELREIAAQRSAHPPGAAPQDAPTPAPAPGSR